MPRMGEVRWNSDQWWEWSAPGEWRLMDPQQPPPEWTAATPHENRLSEEAASASGESDPAAAWSQWNSASYRGCLLIPVILFALIYALAVSCFPKSPYEKCIDAFTEDGRMTRLDAHQFCNLEDREVRED